MELSYMEKSLTNLIILFLLKMETYVKSTVKTHNIMFLICNMKFPDTVLLPFAGFPPLLLPREAFS